MKIRMGFVSNSSSSSFCIYGVKITNEEYNKITDYQGLSESISDNPDNFYGDATYIVGIEAYDLVKDKSKTIEQIEKETIEKLEKVLGKKVENLSVYQNGWYNG